MDCSVFIWVSFILILIINAVFSFKRHVPEVIFAGILKSNLVDRNFEITHKPVKSFTFNFVM